MKQIRCLIKSNGSLIMVFHNFRPLLRSTREVLINKLLIYLATYLLTYYRFKFMTEIVNGQRVEILSINWTNTELKNRKV